MNFFKNSSESLKTESFEPLEQKLEYFVAQIKERFNKYNETEIVNDDGSINTRRYMRKHGGPYAKEDIKDDERLKDKLTKDWASDFYGLEADASDKEVESAVNDYKKLKESGHGKKLEKLLFITLNKMLSPDYFVMHSAEYDDTANGVDFVIVEADTGIVACGFDGLYDTKGGERFQSKVKKLRNQAKKEGVSVKYGFRFENGEIIKQSINNLPNFLLSMDLETIRELENKISHTQDAPSDYEKTVSNSLLQSLEEQLEELKNTSNINKDVEKNLIVFENVLSNIRSVD